MSIIKLIHILAELVPTHSHTTRFASCDFFNTPVYSKNICQRLFLLYQGVQFWNNLSLELRKESFFPKFKVDLKKLLSN